MRSAASCSRHSGEQIRLHVVAFLRQDIGWQGLMAAGLRGKATRKPTLSVSKNVFRRLSALPKYALRLSSDAGAPAGHHWNCYLNCLSTVGLCMCCTPERFAGGCRSRQQAGPLASRHASAEQHQAGEKASGTGNCRGDHRALDSCRCGPSGRAPLLTSSPHMRTGYRCTKVG